MHRMTPKWTFLTLGPNVCLTTPFAFKWSVLVPKGHLVHLEQHRKWPTWIWEKLENWTKMLHHGLSMVGLPKKLKLGFCNACLHRCPYYAHLPEPGLLFEKMIKWHMSLMALGHMMISYAPKWPRFRVKGREKVTSRVTCDQALTCTNHPSISFGWQNSGVLYRIKQNVGKNRLSHCVKLASWRNPEGTDMVSQNGSL